MADSSEPAHGHPHSTLQSRKLLRNTFAIRLKKHGSQVDNFDKVVIFVVADDLLSFLVHQLNSLKHFVVFPPRKKQ